VEGVVTGEVLRASRFEVIDGDGRVRAVLGGVAEFDHQWGLSVFDRDGHERAVLTVGDEEAALVLVHAVGNIAVQLSAFDGAEHTPTESFLLLADPHGTPVVEVRVAPGALFVTGLHRR
jgi:hypothetical protein